MANDVYFKKITFKQGRDMLTQDYGFNATTADALINDFKYLMNGAQFKRAINAYYSNYFLENILLVHGTDRAAMAATSMQLHIEYYENHFKVNLNTLRGVLVDFKRRVVQGGGGDQIEQAVVKVEASLNNLSRKELINKIRELERSDAELVSFQGLKLKRHDYITTLVKELRGYKCQFCDIQIPVRGGGFYIEAAHIQAKKNLGQESLHNLLLLCPNHHKAFDLGEVKVTRTKTHWDISVNRERFLVFFDTAEE